MIERNKFINAEKLYEDLKRVHDARGWNEKDLHYSLYDIELNLAIAENVHAEDMVTLDDLKEAWSIAHKGNLGKKGSWIPLGHIIGPMRHPNSLSYQCSLCGYELYTVFGLPLMPATCPRCGARLEAPDEEVQ